MAQNVPKYIDRLFFDAACHFAQKYRDIEHVQKIIEQIEQHRKEPACGLWNTPPGVVKNRDALLMLANLLRQNASSEVLKVFQYEIDRDVFKQKKYKMVFLLQEYSVFPASEYLYRTAAADPRFEVQAVYVPFVHNNQVGEDHNLETYRDEGIPVLNYDEYDLAAENPDIAIFTKPYNNIPKQYYISEVEKLVKYTIYIPYGLELNQRLIRYGFYDYCQYTVWRHLAYGFIVKEYGKQYGYRNGENIVVWGHPRVDNYLKENRPAPNPVWQEKIKGRKVILWCPHHTIVPGPECVSTWVENHETVFSIFEKHRDLVLLWRPHPLLFGALVNNNYMSQRELDAFLEKKRTQENIILDQTSDYRIAFSMSDALITDGTTFSIEYLLTGKPLLITTDSLDQFYEPEAMEDALYIGRTHEDIQSFVESILSGRDPKRKRREVFTEQLFFRPKDKSVSQNILDNIVLSIEKDSTSLFKFEE